MTFLIFPNPYDVSYHTIVVIEDGYDLKMPYHELIDALIDVDILSSPLHLFDSNWIIFQDYTLISPKEIGERWFKERSTGIAKSKAIQLEIPFSQIVGKA